MLIKMVQKGEAEKESELRQFVETNYHRIRDCHDYKLEYKNCNSLRGRFHQYFIFGETSDCADQYAKWKNCDPCIYDDNFEACETIIRLEDKSKEIRLKNHLANDVWGRRKTPPEGWDAELPEFAQEKMNSSFIALRKSTCTIF